jgi:hypothetical protein
MIITCNCGAKVETEIEVIFEDNGLFVSPEVVKCDSCNVDITLGAYYKIYAIVGDKELDVDEDSY